MKLSGTWWEGLQAVADVNCSIMTFERWQRDDCPYSPVSTVKWEVTSLSGCWVLSAREPYYCGNRNPGALVARWQRHLDIEWRFRAQEQR